MRTAGELGLDVPDDLSVVGFDNIPESALTDPPLTTVDQSIQALGYEAVRMLIELIEQPDQRGDGAGPRHAAHQARRPPLDRTARPDRVTTTAPRH